MKGFVHEKIRKLQESLIWKTRIIRINNIGKYYIHKVITREPKLFYSTTNVTTKIVDAESKHKDQLHSQNINN